MPTDPPSMPPHQAARHTPTSSHDEAEAGREFNGGTGCPALRSAGDGGSRRNSPSDASNDVDDDASEPPHLRLVQSGILSHCSEDSEHMNIYTQLDHFEHSLDAELEELEGYLHASPPTTAAAASSIENIGGDDASSDEDLDAGGVDLSSASPRGERMTLMAPPPSWFQLDEGHVVRQTKKKQPREVAPEGRATSKKKADAPMHRERADARDKRVSGGMPSSNDPTKQQTAPSDAAEPTKSEEADFLPVTLPAYDSPGARMFDLPPPSPVPNDDADLSQLTLPTADLTHATAASLTSSLDTLLQASAHTLSHTLPTLLRECSSSAVQKSVHRVRLEYARVGPGRYLRASDLGNAFGGYYRPPSFRDLHVSGGANDSDSGANGGELNVGSMTCVALGNERSRDDHLDWMWAHDGTEVRFTTLPWIERQLVREWRTYDWTASASVHVDEPNEDGGRSMEHRSSASEEDELMDSSDDDADDIGEEYDRARTLAPRPLPKPEWERAPSCYACDRPFGPTLHRHHCRRCGHSHCGVHSAHVHRLPHLGYDADVPERVCGRCKAVLDARDLQERVSWRLARCRDLRAGNLVPYFETGVDTVEDAAYRLTRLAISLARSIPLGAQAYVALETVEVLRKHGLKGVYGLLLRKEFLAAADLLCRVLGINKKNWPLSVHELSAAIFYALAQHRALRGVRPDGEEGIHALKRDGGDRRAHNELAGSTRRESTGGASATLTVVRETHAEVDEEGDNNGDKTAERSNSSSPSGQDDDEAGDTIVWEGSLRKVPSEPILDETDVYDPSAERVVDLLAMSTSKLVKTADKSADDDMVGSQDQRKPSATNRPSGRGTQSANTNLPFDPVCEHVPNSLISSLLFYAPLALDFIYAECEVDMQLLAAQQGWRLVYASLDQNHHHHSSGHDGNNNGKDSCLGGTESFSDKPASALFAHDEHKIACLSIRGTATIQDVVTDIRAMPVPFPQQQQSEEEEQLDNDEVNNNTSPIPVDGCGDEEWTSVFRGNGLALCGMAGAAANLFTETADSLLYLALRGYKIRIVGHSLGGGVAALLGILLLRHFERQGSDASINEEDFVRVYSYGTPSCVDAKLADHPRTQSLVTSVVMHDDVVPRLTPTSVRGLLKHLLYIRETWVKTHLSDDLNAITERAYHVWPTRLRGSFTLLKKKSVASAKRLKKSCKKRIQGQAKTPTGSSGIENGTESDSSLFAVETTNDENMSDTDTNVSTDEGVDVEGDLFFDPLDDPLNESDDESSVAGKQNAETADGEHDSDWVPFDEPPMESNNDVKGEAAGGIASPQINEDQQPTPDADATPQILEEMPLPRMFIPGKIVHIYTHRGGYKAAFVPRKFRSLRRISMAGNMLTDHMAKSYYEGLLEVKAIRAAKQDLPPWTGFAEDCTCACCASLFTWASTSNTEAQAARDKHNCRACGGLVCDPCSKKRIPIPAIGITAPVRVCDRCYNGWGTLYADLDNVGNETESEGGAACAEKESQKKTENGPTKSRRSAVVDELASRIPSIAS